MLSYLSRVKQGFAVLIARDLLATFAFSFVFLFFQEQGYPLWWLILIYVIYSALGILITVPLNTFYLRSFLLISFLDYSLLAALLAYNPPYAPLLYGILLSFPIIFFWIPLNYIFFRTSRKETNAVDSTLFMVLPGVTSIGMPLLGAFMITHYGYGRLFFLTAVLFLVPLWFIWKNIPEEKLTATTRQGIYNYRGLRTITFLEGSLHFFTSVIIPVYALLFFRQATELGWFFSYLAFISFIIALLLSRHSDKTQRRKSYIFTLFFLLTISIFALVWARTALSWLIAIGLFTTIYTVSSPLRLAVSMDVKKVGIDFWKTREIFLNLGRVITLSIAAAFFYYQLYWLVFVFFGIITFAYPFLVNYKLKEIT